jgi:hypothetical protein
MIPYDALVGAMFLKEPALLDFVGQADASFREDYAAVE